ncbi:GFA family protein [Marinomonas sp. PE14-40]|uniref:GFA family protein n=1 Tax=Marinomonas sp. PE14-40 TaxID=3060621 RepID=UPI003F671B0C
MIKGSCLCGNVTYEISGDLGDIVHCHCVTCRKAHGAAFSSVASVPLSAFTLMNEQLLNSFESSPGKVRHFCANCGTQIYAKRDKADHIILRLGSLDDEISSKEISHIWTSQKADWYEINSSLAEHLEFD